MIVSFHPCIEADIDIICAGRRPDNEDLKAIRAADAVILPQGCSAELYEMARNNCRYVFPDYNARFAYPGKIGQIELFRKTETAHPKTEVFRDVKAYMDRYSGYRPPAGLDYPMVFKFPWGGEGEGVHLIRSVEALSQMLETAAVYERGGQKGFLLQEYIPTGGKSVRVVVVGKTIISYWRIQPKEDRFYSSLAAGGVIDIDSDSAGRTAAENEVIKFCHKTGVNLAGFDLIFTPVSGTKKERKPLFLEINYFFGRQGLGGSEKFYSLLQTEVEKWLRGLNLFLKPKKSPASCL